MIKYKQLSIGDRLISKNETTESLEALVDTLNFIDVWIKLLKRIMLANLRRSEEQVR